MQSNMFFQCKCGQGYLVYVPTTISLEGSEMNHSDQDRQHIEDIPSEEQLAGEVEFAKFTAEQLSLQFIDSRKLSSMNPSIQCGCGEKLAIRAKGGESA